MGRHNPKREHKKRERARGQSGSQYRLIGAAGEVVACCVNKGWAEEGKASISLLRRIPGGGHAMGAFLVDLWCMGLKEAWGRLDATYEEFREGVLDRAEPELSFEPIAIETARRLVAGGIRFAEQNGFRLPPRHERWTALLGEIGDPAKADLSDFGVDGKLRYEGSLEDLKRRLIGCRVEDVIGDDDFTLLDDATVAVEEIASTLRERVVSGTRQWCFANGQAPHARLEEAWDLMIEAIMLSEELPEEGEPDEAALDAVDNRARSLLSLSGPNTGTDLAEAMEQVRAYMGQFQSAEAMMAALQLEEASEGDEEENG
jgi:hypothetical protein